MNGAMSAIGTKRTSLVASHMSAFGGKADMAIAMQNVGFWSKADIGADGQARLAVCRFFLAAVALAF